MLVLVNFGENALSSFHRYFRDRVSKTIKTAKAKLKWKLLDRELKEEERDFFRQMLPKELKFTAQKICENGAVINEKGIEEAFNQMNFPVLEVKLKRRGKNFEPKSGLLAILPVVCYSDDKSFGVDIIILNTFKNLEREEEVLEKAIGEITQPILVMLLSQL